MPARYAPLPNPHTDPDAQNEMEAAFLESDDEDEDHQPVTQPSRNGYSSLANDEPSSATRDGPAPYDFENVAYDADWARPPPGSPPPGALFPHAQGNSNGLVPDFSSVPPSSQRPGGWLRRTAQRVLPSQYAERLGLRGHRPDGAVGGGSVNDGVFANVTAKPSTGVRVQDGAFNRLTLFLFAVVPPPSWQALVPGSHRLCSQVIARISSRRRLRRMHLHRMHLHRQMLFHRTGRRLFTRHLHRPRQATW